MFWECHSEGKKLSLTRVISLFGTIIALGVSASNSAQISSELQRDSPLSVGELHYSRIPSEYWLHRLRLAKSIGLEAISTYVFWNMHEPRGQEFVFEGQADIAAYCRIAGENGLKVILRPGPYICSEWDFGGLPSWLLKKSTMKVRTRNPEFLGATRRYFLELGKHLAPLQANKGGPIVMVQVENEYDGYGKDPQYVNALVGLSLQREGFLHLSLFRLTLATHLQHVRNFRSLMEEVMRFR